MVKTWYVHTLSDFEPGKPYYQISYSESFRHFFGTKSYNFTQVSYHRLKRWKFLYASSAEYANTIYLNLCNSDSLLLLCHMPKCIFHRRYGASRRHIFCTLGLDRIGGPQLRMESESSSCSLDKLGLQRLRGRDAIIRRMCSILRRRGYSAHSRLHHCITDFSTDGGNGLEGKRFHASDWFYCALDDICRFRGTVFISGYWHEQSFFVGHGMGISIWRDPLQLCLSNCSSGLVSSQWFCLRCNRKMITLVVANPSLWFFLHPSCYKK